MIEGTFPALEHDLEQLIAKHQREQHGHAPESCEATLLPDKAIIISRGIFTPTERHLCETNEGRKLVQGARRELRALTRKQIESDVSKCINRQVLRSYYDLDVRSGEQCEVYMLA